MPIERRTFGFVVPHTSRMTSTESPLGHRSRTRRSLVATAIAVIVVCVVLAQQLWWSKPTAFGPANSFEFRQVLKTNETYSINMFSTKRAEDVRLHSAEPIIVKNTADATIDFVVCRYETEWQMGSIVGSMDRYCSSAPLQGYLLRKDHHLDDTIYMRITPRKAGVVRLDGMTVNYSRGWGHLRQTGSEPIEGKLVSNVK